MILIDIGLTGSVELIFRLIRQQRRLAERVSSDSINASLMPPPLPATRALGVYDYTAQRLYSQ